MVPGGPRQPARPADDVKVIWPLATTPFVVGKAARLDTGAEG